MEDNIEYNLDAATDEVNCTSLAEDAAQNFDLYDEDKPQEWLFDLAVAVEDLYYELERE